MELLVFFKATNDTFSDKPLLDPGVERWILQYNRTSVWVYLGVSSAILVLCLVDVEKRNIVYRRFLSILQLWSSMISWALAFVPQVILPIHKAAYAIEHPPFRISMIQFSAILFAIFFQTFCAYIACVLYLHQSLLSNGSPYRFTTAKFYTFLALHSLLFLAFAGCVYTALEGSAIAEEFLPHRLLWLTTRPTYYALTISWRAISLVIAPCCLLLPPYYIGGYLVIGHMLGSLRSGMVYASERTKRYQRTTVYTVAMQGLVPFCSLWIPVAIAMLSIWLPFIPTEVPAIAFAFMNTHPLLNSLTLLLRSRRYMAQCLIPLKFLAEVFSCIRLSNAIGKVSPMNSAELSSVSGSGEASRGGALGGGGGVPSNPPRVMYNHAHPGSERDGEITVFS